MENEPIEYKGHLIELRSPQNNELVNFEVRREVKPELLIDNKSVNYGQLPDGTYFLDEYAYDWRDNLIDLAKRFIDYKSSVDVSNHEDKAEGED